MSSPVHFAFETLEEFGQLVQLLRNQASVWMNGGRFLCLRVELSVKLRFIL